jgi:hypothetical protein
MIVRWLIVGFALWLVVTLGFRFVGHSVFTAGPDGVSWLFMILPLVFLGVTYLLLKLLKVDPTDRSEAASIMAVPGLLIGIYQINSYSVIFPNLDPTLAPQFASLMFACYAAVIIAGIVSSHLKGI